MPVIIPVQPIANQVFNVLLDGQYCTIGLYSRNGHLFMNLAVDDTNVFLNSLCVNMNSVAQFNTHLFKGMLMFIDTLGKSAPFYSGLGSRFLLFYYTADELEAASDEALSYVR